MNEKENKSIWNDTVKFGDFPCLDKNIETDVVVIGGGISGILTAHRLQREGFKVILLEKDTIGSGITNRTTAFVSAFHDTLYQDLIANIGFEKAKLYLEANLNAIKEYEKLAEKYEFDYQTVSSCFYSTDDDKVIIKEYEILKRLGLDAKLIDDIPLPIKISKGIEYKNQGQMNALKLINVLSKELEIYEHTEVVEVCENEVSTPKYKVKAKNIVICTHFPIKGNLIYSMRMYQNRSYVVAIENEKSLNSTYTEIKNDGLYFRSYNNYLIIGGNDTRTGVRNSAYKKIKDFVKANYPDKELKYIWANQDLITLDDVPYIGYINLMSKNIYVATGFNLWGMTTAMISSNLICDLIMKKYNKFQDLYSPSRNMIRKKLFSNMWTFIKGLCGFKKKRCSHLGCTLTFNGNEQSWDCPCHGSRFSIYNKVINDPAKKELKK